MEIPVKKLASKAGYLSAIALGLGLQLLPSVDYINQGDKFIKPDFNNGKLGYELSLQRGFPYRSFQSLGLLIGITNIFLLLLPMIEQAIKEEKEKDLLMAGKPKLEDLPLTSPDTAIESPAIAPKAIKVKSLSERLQADAQDILDWLETPHQSVAGNSGSGKTTVMQYVISLWLQENPSGNLVILDCNIGKPDSKGKPNNWCGLAKNYGKASLTAIAQAMDEVYAELNKRLETCRQAVQHDIDYLEFSPYLVVIDEFNSLQSELKTELKYDIVSKVQLLLQQGRALNMKVLLGLQSFDKETSNLPMASNAMTSKLWLGYKDLPTYRQFNYLDIVASDQARIDFTELIKARKRAGLIQINGANRAITMPDLSKSIVIQLDEAEVWWQEWKANNEQTLERAIQEGISPSALSNQISGLKRGTAKFAKLQRYMQEQTKKLNKQIETSEEF